MALGYGITNKMRGKLGGAIYRIEHGKQIVSEYNPSKTGAPSQKQLIQRAKMSAAYGVSRVFPFECITGLSPYPSTARNKFIAQLVKAAIVSNNTPDRVDAVIDAQNIKISTGAAIQYLNYSLTKLTTDVPKINASLLVPLPSAVESFLLVVLTQDSSTGAWCRTFYQMSETKSTQGRMLCTMILTETDVPPRTTAFAYIVPVSPNTLAKRVRYEQLLTLSPAGLFTAEVAIEYSRAKLLAESIYIGSLVFD